MHASHWSLIWLPFRRFHACLRVDLVAKKNNHCRSQGGQVVLTCDAEEKDSAYWQENPQQPKPVRFGMLRMALSKSGQAK